MPKVDVITEDHCPHCGSGDIVFEGQELVEYYETQCNCPNCRKSFILVLREDGTFLSVKVMGGEYSPGSPLITAGKEQPK